MCNHVQSCTVMYSHVHVPVRRKFYRSTYSSSSLVGLVSSNLRWHVPPVSSAIPKLRHSDLACPICKWPFGSGGLKNMSIPPPPTPHLRVYIILKLPSGASEAWRAMAGKSHFLDTSKSLKLEKYHLSSKKLEKARESSKKLEKTRESSRKLEKSRKSSNNLEK